MRSSTLIVAVVWMLCAPVAHAMDIPTNDAFVTDAAKILTAEQERSLEQDLRDYRTATSNEVVIITIPSLDGEVIADVAVEIGREWGVGTKENDNGIVILLAYEDREIFIAAGYGLEGALPDLAAKGVIDTYILPKFRVNNYYEGLVAGVDAIKKHIEGEYTADQYSNDNESGGFNLFLFYFLVFLAQWGIAILGRTKSWWLGGVIGFIIGIFVAMYLGWWPFIIICTLLGLFLDFIVSLNYKSNSKTSWWAGGSWGPGGGGGGGFGGFSGGSFGGGGAGGSW